MTLFSPNTEVGMGFPSSQNFLFSLIYSTALFATGHFHGKLRFCPPLQPRGLPNFLPQGSLRDSPICRLFTPWTPARFVLCDSGEGEALSPECPCNIKGPRDIPCSLHKLLPDGTAELAHFHLLPSFIFLHYNSMWSFHIMKSPPVLWVGAQWNAHSSLYLAVTISGSLQILAAVSNSMTHIFHSETISCKARSIIFC